MDFMNTQALSRYHDWLIENDEKLRTFQGFELVDFDELNI